MTEITNRAPDRHPRQAASHIVESANAAVGDVAISPQDFYRELTARDDVRRILTRLAQVSDGHV